MTDEERRQNRETEQKQEAALCPDCGAPLDDTWRPCPRCLMKLAEEPGREPNVGPPSVDILRKAFAGEFEILELIGRGGMSAVYKARQPELDRPVAIKILYGKLAQNASFTERFRREAKFLARLNHPNIVTIHEFGSKTLPPDDYNIDDNNAASAGGNLPILYLVMEFIDGVNLRQAMRGERFTPEQALTLIPKI